MASNLRRLSLFFVIIVIFTTVQYSDAVFIWTAAPSNPTELILDRSASLKWDYLSQNESISFVSFSRYDATRGLKTVARKMPTGEYLVYAKYKGSVSVVDKATLVIRVVRRNDSGSIFCCEVHLSGTSKTSCVSTTLLVPPVITSKPENSTVLEGSAVSLFCNATGNPTPTVDWIRGDKDVGLSLPPGTVLSFSRVTRNDTGLYRCRATNKAGVVYSVAYIDVQYSSSAAILPQGNNITVNQTDVIRLTCHVTGNPSPSIVWIKDGDVVNVLTNQSRLALPVRGKGDGGQYACHSWNRVGHPSVARATVRVMNYQPFNITMETCPGVTILEEKDEFVIQCSADANPSAAYMIYHNEKLIRINRSGYHKICRVKKVHAGNYSCVAYNGYGKARSSSVVRLDVVYPATVHVWPPSLNITEGDDVMFRCTTTGNPPPTIEWRKEGDSQVISTDGVLVMRNTSRLVIGKYTCTARNGVGVPATNTSVLNIYYAPKITEAPQTKTVNETSSVSLYCEAEGNPEPYITWSKVDSPHRLENSTEERLTFRNMSRGDTGVYVCVASNILGNDSATATLQVQYKPSNTVIQSSSPHNVGIVGAAVTLLCRTGAFPPADLYEMFFNGNPLSVNADGRIQLPSVDKSHEGMYQCTASNALGRGTKASLFLEVKAPAKMTNAPPENQLIKEGNSLRMRCNASGDPPPNITWSHVNRTENGILSTGEVYYIHEVTRDDAGLYVCMASNGVGKPVVAFAKVAVTYKPEITSKALSTFKSELGIRARIHCTVDGYPLPYVIWEPRPLSSNVSQTSVSETVVTSTLTFIPTNESDFGLYKCHGWNSDGNTTASIILRHDADGLSSKHRASSTWLGLPPLVTLAILTGGTLVIVATIGGVFVWTINKTGKGIISG